MKSSSDDIKIEYVCPLCDTHFRAGSHRAGTTIPCPSCQQPVQLSAVPGADAPGSGTDRPRGSIGHGASDRPAPTAPDYGRGLNGFSRRHAWIHLATAVLVIGYLGWRVVEHVRERAAHRTNFAVRLSYDCSTPEAGARAQFQMVADHNVDALNAVVAAEQLTDVMVREARSALQSMEVARVARWTWPNQAMATPANPSRDHAFVFVKYRRPEAPADQPPWRLRYVVLGLARIGDRWVPSADARPRLWHVRTSPPCALLRREITDWEARSESPR